MLFIPKNVWKKLRKDKMTVHEDGRSVSAICWGENVGIKYRGKAKGRGRGEGKRRSLKSQDEILEIKETDEVTFPDGTKWSPEFGLVQFDFTFYTKPKSNHIVLDIDLPPKAELYYQPELTQEEIDEGCIRPDWVVGSYAVYLEGRKLGHFARPHATDANGNWTWGTLQWDESTKKLTKIIPQEWLDNAAYPITIDPTFGRTTAGGTGYTQRQQYQYSYGPFTAPENGTITDVYWYGYIYRGNSGTMYYGVHDKGAGDYPGTLLGSNSVGIGGGAAWRSVSGLSIPMTGGNTYYLSNTSTYWTNYGYYDSGSSGNGLWRKYKPGYASPLTDHNGSSIYLNSRLYSSYAVYEEAEESTTYRGLYKNHQNWSSTNWSRMVTAHGTLHGDFEGIDDYYPGTFNLLTDGQTEGNLEPSDDNSLRDSAHATGVANGSTYANGADFLTKGNYVHPDIEVYYIQRVSDEKTVYLDPVGKVYFPGSPNSYNPTRDAVTRNVLHLIAPVDLKDASRFGSVSVDDVFIVGVGGIPEEMEGLENLTVAQVEEMTVTQLENLAIL